MAIFGNTGTDTDNLILSNTDQFIHGDVSELETQWGAGNVPLCTVTKMWVYARGSDTSTPAATVRMGIYDASNIDPELWPVEVESPTFEVDTDNTAKWYSIDCSLELIAGPKCLAIIAYGGHQNSCNIYYNTVVGLTNNTLTFIDTVGQFDDPLGDTIGSLNDWCMYVEYTEITPTTDTLTITSDARIIDPNIFTFATPAAIGASDRQNEDVYDIKLRHTCTHNLAEGQLTLSTCTRCLGTGYYHDAKFNAAGKLTELSLEDKLQQALEKLVLTDSNRFHENVSIGVKKWIGDVPLSKIKTVIQYDLMQGITGLKGSQKRIMGLNPRAQIASIDNIEATITAVDSLRYIVTITTLSGVTSNLTGVIDFSEIISN